MFKLEENRGYQSQRRTSTSRFSKSSEGLHLQIPRAWHQWWLTLFLSPWGWPWCCPNKLGAVENGSCWQKMRWVNGDVIQLRTSISSTWCHTHQPSNPTCIYMSSVKNPRVGISNQQKSLHETRDELQQHWWRADFWEWPGGHYMKQPFHGPKMASLRVRWWLFKARILHFLGISHVPKLKPHKNHSLGLNFHGP